MYRIIGADGQQYGPVSAEQMRQWIAEGRINSQTMVMAQGTTEWKPLSAFPEFSAPVGGGSLPASTPQYPNPQQAPQFGAPQQKTNALAMTGMILGIASLCCGGPLLAIPGIICSSIGLSQINKNPTVEGGKGMAIAGLIISIVSLVLGTLWLILVFGLGLLEEMNR
jgi:hypothetical protein